MSSTASVPSPGTNVPTTAPAAMAGPAVEVRSWWRSLSLWFVGSMLFVGLFAPLLANDVPLVARVAGSWSFPAFADLVGAPPVGPGDLSWKQWWAQLPSDGDDFAWMPPWPYGPNEIDPLRYRLGPCLAHPFGNDDTGRDVLARVVHGASTVAELALPAVLLGMLVGTLLGAWAGYRRGVVEVLVLRAIELFLCFPTLLFLLFAAAFLGNSRHWCVLVMAAMFWTSFARIVRGAVLSLRERDFVLVARGLGQPEWRILTHHLLPQVASQVGVTAAFCLAAAVVAEATLSFLGIGPRGALASWGAMLRQGNEQIVLGVWHSWLFPAAAVVAFVIACHTLAERLRQYGEEAAG